MKRTALMGFTMLMIALMLPTYGRAAQPAQAKQSIDDAYTTFYIATEPQRSQLAEKFLTDYKGSTDPSAEQYFEAAFGAILTSATKANNFAKIIDFVDRNEQLVPGAPKEKKASYYGQGMEAATNANNAPKVLAFGDKVLALVPDGPESLNTLVTLSSTISQVSGSDKTALAKSDDFAKRALAVVAKLDPKALGLTDAAWAGQRIGIEGTLHATLGGNALNRGESEKAVEELGLAVKDDPKNSVAWYYQGQALSQQAAALSHKVQDGFTEANKMVAAKADRNDIDEKKAINEGLTEQLRAKRDSALDSLATSVALGGPAADPAKAKLQELWRQKNGGSVDGIEQFIISKKPQN